MHGKRSMHRKANPERCFRCLTRSQGGLQEGAILELSNGSKALILKVTDENVTLDANNMLAGKKLFFSIDLLEIDRPQTAQS